MLKYRDIKYYLIGSAFVDESVSGSHHAYRHSESGTLILLPFHFGDDEAVRQEDLVSVRRHLVENRLISEDEFSRFLRTGVRPAKKRR
jgi:predicted RNA binding protein YcfA (HicA-like mRNA interferase family)